MHRAYWVALSLVAAGCADPPIETVCGDGVTEGDESCDDGVDNSDTEPDACRLDCQPAGCGDGTLDSGETCDDGGESTLCDANCTPAGCGDLTTNLAAGEDCDGGGETSACDDDCTFAECGDGTLNLTAGEQCDDGNGDNGDDCPDGTGGSCAPAVCGDGFTRVSDEECDDGNVVNTDACRNDCLDGSAGDPCAADAECAGGLCAADGACRTTCNDEDGCAAGETCTAVERLAGGAGSGCLDEVANGVELGERCQDDGDCRTRLCAGGRCAEICTSCDPGAVCVPESVTRFGTTLDLGLCAWSLAEPDVRLGPITTTDSGSAELTFDVPSGVTAFTLVALDEQEVGDYAQRAGFHRLEAPDGTVLIDHADGLPDLNPYATPYPGAAAVLVPSTDDAAARPQAGTYRLRVGIYETADFITYTPVEGEVDEVRVVLEREGEQGGVLDLNLFFAPGTGLTAADAPSSGYVTDVVGTMNYVLNGLANVRLGEVDFYDLPDTHDVVSSFDQVREICELYALPGPHGVAVNLFIVEQVTMTAGVSGGIPGPPGVFGTPASGVVAYDIAANAVTMGITLAHETGHFLGLMHTSQIDFTNDEVVGEDPISDTPVCDAAVLPTHSDCADYPNLMFPVFRTWSLEMSPAQVQVLRGNSLLYEVDRRETCPVASAVYDITAAGFGTSDTSGLAADFAGSCGGVSAPERVHLYRVSDSGLSQLEVSVIGEDFAPLVHVRHGGCGAVVAEVACDSADAEVDVTLTVDAPDAGAYFIFVDGRDGDGGTFTLTVTEIP